MKQLLLVSLLSIVSFNSFAQILFEKGYFINNNNERVDCLIENISQSSTPISFNYKLSETSETISLDLRSAKEVGILKEVKYQRFTVDLDLSSDNLANLGTEKNANYQQKQLFLKVILEGQAQLFSYKQDNAVKFFYSLGDAHPKQLFYKRYRTGLDKVKVNNQYQQQIFNDLKCEALSSKEMSKLKYKKSNLVKLFTAYNEHCSDGRTIVYKAPKKRKAFKLSIKPRWNLAQFSIENEHGRPDTEIVKFPQNAQLQFGLELEYILAFNGARWSIFMEPVYRHYEAELSSTIGYRFESLGVVLNRDLKTELMIDYEVVEIPIGFRYHVFPESDLKLFASAAYAFEIPINRMLISSKKPGTLTLNPEHITYLGIGTNYKHKYGMELRYGFRRELVNNYAPWKSYYNSLSIILAYNFL